MKLVDAVIGLKICFEDENGKEINPKLGLMQPLGKKRLGLTMWLEIRGNIMETSMNQTDIVDFNDETQGRDESATSE